MLTMFVSFFPRPKLFFLSAIVWTSLAMLVWYGFASNLFEAPQRPVGLATFTSAPALWFDLYFAACAASFAAIWMLLAPHPWANWSILGSALILFTSYFQVQVSVAINSWYGPFYDLIQAALSKSAPVTVEQFYAELSTFAGIALVAVVVGVLTRFFVSHYIFRWRTAMNDFYVANWPRLRTIEGASQRVQEDTMRFATTMEGLGVNLISALLTLLAFLPVLVKLSGSVTELPVIGSIPYPLVFAAVIWSVFGTGVLALIGIRLPAIEFFNQRVEAAYRKELVLGEDDPARADPPTLSVLFGDSQELFSPLFELHVFQRRPHRLPADRRHLSLRPARTNNHCGQDHARNDEPDLERVHAGPNLVSVSRQRVEHDRRIDLDLSTAAEFRGQAPRGAAALNRDRDRAIVVGMMRRPSPALTNRERSLILRASVPMRRTPIPTHRWHCFACAQPEGARRAYQCRRPSPSRCRA